MSKQTASISNGRCAARHDARIFVSDNVHQEMLSENVHIVYRPVQDAFHEEFDESVAEYNSRQTRKDRMKNDYYKEIVDGRYTVKNGQKVRVMNAPKPEYEYVVQFGNRDTNPASVLNEAGERVLGPYADVSRKALLKFFEEFRKNNPNLSITGASIHMDEATPHLHVRFIPVATEYKNGMKKRCSLTHALANMGYERGSARGNNLSVLRWKESQEKLLEQIGQEFGFEIVEGNSKGRKHIENHEWCAGIGDEITELERNAAAWRHMAEHEEARAEEAHNDANNIVAVCAEQIRQAQESMQTTLKSKEEYDKEIERLRGSESPLKQFFDAVNSFIKALSRCDSKQEIKAAAMNLLRPFPALNKKIKNTAGFENIHNLPKEERETPKLISDVNELLSDATARSEPTSQLGAAVPNKEGFEK